MVDDGYGCALNSSHESQPPLPELLPTSLRWGQVIALVVRQPSLARALGLINETTIKPPDNFFARGGWLYITLDPTSEGATTAGLTVVHAARIPPLSATTSRDIYTPVLFPVDRPNWVADDIFREAERYDTGYARLVHGLQNESAATDGDAIQLGWDDEQLAEWLNRQLDPRNESPMGTAGYRVDVRDVTTANPSAWNSLQMITAPQGLKLDTISLGAYTGEGMVEVLPSRVSRTAPTEYWMPPYFAIWRGTSLVLTDSDLNRVHKRTNIDWSKADPASRLNRDSVFQPVNDTNVRLLYGHKYEFRVRLADLTGGGPGPLTNVPSGADAFHTTAVTFRRRKPPGPVSVTQRPAKGVQLKIARPLLAYPEILYTSANVSFANVEAALNANLLREVGLALPDPDVTEVQITAQVRALLGDREEWYNLYPPVKRTFTANEIAVNVEFSDPATLVDFPVPAANGALKLPTARDVRLILTSLGRTDAGYFADPKLRDGPPTIVELHVVATTEGDLLPANTSPDVTSFYLRQPPPDGSVARPVERLATELSLDHHNLTLAGRAKGRTVFGCSAKLRHTLSPEASAITFSSDADVTQQWVHAVRFVLARDWTWRGLAPDGITVSRQIQWGSADMGPWEVVGTVSLPNTLAANAIKDVANGKDATERRRTNIVFFDAHDPKPDPTAATPQYPTEQKVRYKIQPRFEGITGPEKESAPVRVPATTPPSQVPQLLSMGIALQELPANADEFKQRRAVLWVEFAEAPRDPDDRYFVRPLVAAPDPLLIDAKELVVPETQPEPALPIDPEWIRMIRAGQAADTNGAQAMQAVGQRAQQGECYVVPLPEGVDASSPELFNMYTYEFRVGHVLDNTKRWCTANGRWGPPLRVTGIKHPPPQLMCQAQRSEQGVVVRAPFATPTLGGRHVRPSTPKTQLWALIYARVQQADATAWRYVLIGRAPLFPPAPGVISTVSSSVSPPVLLGELPIPNEPLRLRLKTAGLPPETALAVLAVEAYTEPTFSDPLGFDLGFAPFLRTSPLVPVPETC